MLTWEKSLRLLGLVYLILWGRQRAQQCGQWSMGYLCGGRERGQASLLHIYSELWILKWQECQDAFFS